MARLVSRTGPMALASTLLAALVQLSHQHAYLAYPESRNYQAFLIPPPESKYYCPHCGQGGGAGKTPSMCGDPFQDVVSNSAFVPFTNRFYRTTTLTAGQTINIQISISTNHGGRMSVAICPLARGQVTQDCFNQPQNRLRRVHSDPKYNNKWYWYLSPANSVSAETTYKLPDGVTCENGCMMQWWWVGYQSCTLPCEDSSVDVPGECNTNPLNPPVSRCTSILQTEQFANCADIIIKSGGTPSATPTPSYTVASPPPRATVAPSPSPRSASPPPGPPVTPGDCPAGDWLCSSCSQAAAGSAAATGLVSACYSCSTSSKEPSACAQCLKSSSVKEIITGCLSCVSRGLPGWACNQQCAQVAQSAPQMTACSDCLATPGVNSWGCQNCLQMSGSDVTKTNQCLACVKAGRDGWACGQCATKSSYAMCYTCLASAGTNTWPCLA